MLEGGFEPWGFEPWFLVEGKWETALRSWVRLRGYPSLLVELELGNHKENRKETANAGKSDSSKKKDEPSALKSSSSLGS